MVSVHPVAAGGFSSAASTSARIRARYARASVGQLVDTIRLEGPGARVVDVGAGTGILTGQLRRLGIECVAVEPSTDMARHLRLALPDVPVVLGAAEHLPLPGGRAAVYTAAQAFHWFDPEAALAEAARVLRPGGWVCLMWNVPDRAVPWVAGLTELVEARAGGRPDPLHDDAFVETAVRSSGRFGPVEVTPHPNPVPAGVEAVLERLRSTSSVAAMQPEPREDLLAAARDLLADHDMEGDFEYPHQTVLYRCRLED